MSSQLAEQISKRAATAARAVANLSEAKKNQVLQRMADAIRASQAEILKVNESDMQAGREKGLSDAMLDRLQLDAERIEGMASAIEEIIELADPVGERRALRLAQMVFKSIKCGFRLALFA